MAAAVITLSNIKQGTTISGKRMVTATVDFDTGDSTTNGVPLATTSTVYPTVTATGAASTATATSLLSALGLRQIDEMYILAHASVDEPYTKALWDTANGTVTYNYFLDNGTNGTPKAPLLKIQSAGSQVGTGNAIAATAQFRARFVGS